MRDLDTTLIAAVEESGADEQRIEELTIRLRRELSQITEASLRRSEAGALDGSKGLDGATLGSIVVAIASSSVLVEVVRVISGWASRGRDRHVRITYADSSIELSSASAKDQESLVADFIANAGIRSSGDPHKEDT